MATDHRGRDVHAGKRTFDELLLDRINTDLDDALNTTERMPREYDRNFDAKNPAYVAAKGKIDRALTASIFNPYKQFRMWEPGQMLPFRGGLNMSRNIMDDQDTAHISLSNDEYL